MKRILFALAVVLFSFVAISWHQQETSREVISFMLSSIDKLQTAKFTFKSWERFENGRETFNEVDTKLNVKPFKIYLLSKSKPNEGVEVIYNAAEYGSDKVAINPGGWLPNVKLDPYGSRMRKDQHHTVMNSGFGMLREIVGKAVARTDKEAPGRFNEVFKYEGSVTWNGRACHKVVIEDPTFTYVDYTVKAGETVESLEQRDAICGYLIIDKNDNVSDFDDLKEGMVIKKPSSYAKKTILYIDKANGLPIVQIMHDEVGQFERYEFHDLKANVTFQPVEFTKDYDGYDF